MLEDGIFFSCIIIDFSHVIGARSLSDRQNRKREDRQGSYFFYANVALYFLIYLFIYLFLAVLGLCFCARAFSSCGKRRPLFIAVRGPPTIAASLVAEHKLQMRRLSSCGSWAQLLYGMWDLPRPGLEPVSPALAGRFSATVPPGKPALNFLISRVSPCSKHALPHFSPSIPKRYALSGEIHCLETEEQETSHWTHPHQHR